jgi:hypothetical protein
MVSRLRIGPDGGPFVLIDEDNGTLDIDAPSGSLDFQSNQFLNAAVHNVTTVTSNITATTGQVVLADASGGSVGVTLPTPANGETVTVKKIDSSANPVVIATPGTETIDGQSTIDISNQFGARETVSDGSNYFII